MAGVRDDGELLNSWQAGDRTAGEALYDRYFEVVQRFFTNKVDDDDQQPLIQDTFTALLAPSTRFEGRSSFSTYLLGIANNKLLKHWRKRQSRGKQIDVSERSLADMGAGPSTVLARDRSLKRLLTALRQLPLGMQVALELYYWEDMTGPELAATLGVSEPAIRSRLHRAKQRLYATMRDLEQSAAAPESTNENLELWARGVRTQLFPGGPRS